MASSQGRASCSLPATSQGGPLLNVGDQPGAGPCSLSATSQGGALLTVDEQLLGAGPARCYRARAHKPISSLVKPSDCVTKSLLAALVELRVSLLVVQSTW